MYDSGRSDNSNVRVAGYGICKRKRNRQQGVDKNHSYLNQLTLITFGPTTSIIFGTYSENTGSFEI